MRTLPFLLALGIALPAAAEVPEKWHAALAEQLPSGQRIVQTLAGDVDNDGKDEWIAIGEPTAVPGREVSVAIFSPAQGKAPPRLRFAQRLRGEGLERAGAAVQKVSPIGNALVVVGAAPRSDGDSTFVMQLYAWNGKRFRPVVPERLDFRSQGGFAIENVDPTSKGDEIVRWSYVRGPHEQLFDLHHYETQIYRWDGLRFISPDRPSRTAGQLASPDDAARSLGVKTGDQRRRIPRVAEVP